VDRQRARAAGFDPRRRCSGARFSESLLDRQQAFGYTQEDLKFLLAPMATAGEEGIGSMGNDSPLAVLSDKNKPLYNYFKQLFAQVTNPPIDPIREAIVMSLNCFIGPKPNLLDINAVNPPMRLEVAQPILDFKGMARLRNIEAATGGKFKPYEIDITYPLAWGKAASRPSWPRCAPRAWMRSRAATTS
jgi:glutamate synthase (NADPH/NADH) large chain